MLKFQGGFIVRNMLVITLLIMGGLFAFYYVPMAASGTNSDKYEAGYSFFYTANADEVTAAEVDEMAAKYDVEVKNYREAQFIEVKGDGVTREDLDKYGNMIEEYEEVHASYQCISASQYEILTGEKVNVSNGTYYMIMSVLSYENIFNHFGDMGKLYQQSTGEFIGMKYIGNVVYESLIFRWGFDDEMRCVISDHDYALLRERLSKEQIIIQVLFDTEDSEPALEFANELYKEFSLRMADNMKVPGSYNPGRQELAGEEYGYDYQAIYDAENPAKETDWRYVPNFVYLTASNAILQNAVFFLMFLYVAVICLAAVGIISYTRSRSVGLSSQQVFDDLQKLGATRQYVGRLLKAQMKKVFVLPTVVGCIGMAAFEILIMYMNDGRYDANEIKAMSIMLLLTLAVVLYQYVLYKVSMKKVASILNLPA